MSTLKLEIYDTIEEENEPTEDIMDNLKSLERLSIYDVLGEEHNIFLKKNTRHGFDLLVQNVDSSDEFGETGLHPYAIQSLAAFCRSFLRGYNKFQLEDGVLC